MWVLSSPAQVSLPLTNFSPRRAPIYLPSSLELNHSPGGALWSHQVAPLPPPQNDPHLVTVLAYGRPAAHEQVDFPPGFAVHYLTRYAFPTGGHSPADLPTSLAASAVVLLIHTADLNAKGFLARLLHVFTAAALVCESGRTFNTHADPNLDTTERDFPSNAPGSLEYPRRLNPLGLPHDFLYPYFYESRFYVFPPLGGLK